MAADRRKVKQEVRSQKLCPWSHEAAYIIRYLGSRCNSQSKRFSVPLVGFLDDRLRAYRCSKAPEVVLRMERRQRGRWRGQEGD